MPLLNLNAPERLLLMAACGVLLSQALAPGFGGSGFSARSLGPCTAFAQPVRAGMALVGERCPLRAATGY